MPLQMVLIISYHHCSDNNKTISWKYKKRIQCSSQFICKNIPTNINLKKSKNTPTSNLEESLSLLAHICHYPHTCKPPCPYVPSPPVCTPLFICTQFFLSEIILSSSTLPSFHQYMLPSPFAHPLSPPIYMPSLSSHPCRRLFPCMNIFTCACPHEKTSRLGAICAPPSILQKAICALHDGPCSI